MTSSTSINLKLVSLARSSACNFSLELGMPALLLARCLKSCNSAGELHTNEENEREALFSVGKMSLTFEGQ